MSAALPVYNWCGLDIDGVVANWGHTFFALGHSLGYDTLPHRWYEQTSWDLKDQDAAFELWDRIRHDPDFWLNIMPFLDEPKPRFVPGAYVTNRPIASAITMQWLSVHGYPLAEVITVHPDIPDPNNRMGFKDKFPALVTKGITTFVEDRPDAFESLRERGIHCLLMDRPWNGHLKTKYRIYDVNEALVR